ncbi:MAG: hypothetical protein ACODAD_01875 [Planctomycetota bacterium]
MASDFVAPRLIVHVIVHVIAHVIVHVEPRPEQTSSGAARLQTPPARGG